MSRSTSRPQPPHIDCHVRLACLSGALWGLVSCWRTLSQFEGRAGDLIHNPTINGHPSVGINTLTNQVSLQWTLSCSPLRGLCWLESLSGAALMFTDEMKLRMSTRGLCQKTTVEVRMIKKTQIQLHFLTHLIAQLVYRSSSWWVGGSVCVCQHVQDTCILYMISWRVYCWSNECCN